MINRWLSPTAQVNKVGAETRHLKILVHESQPFFHKQQFVRR